MDKNPCTRAREKVLWITFLHPGPD